MRIRTILYFENVLGAQMLYSARLYTMRTTPLTNPFEVDPVYEKNGRATE
jgi:hypothetical protein